MNNSGEWERRSFLIAMGGLASAAQFIGGTTNAIAAPVDSAASDVTFGKHALRIADLTHKLTREFNLDPAHPRLAMESVDGSGAAVGMRINRLSLIEHTGTHIDAPSHFGPSLKSLGDIPAIDLVVPLAVISIADKAAQSCNAQLEPADIERWEQRHGALPEGCCVAIDSGWDPHAETERMRRERIFSATGCSLEAAIMLAEKRSVKGLAVDSMTLDAAPNVPSYPVHQYWLRSGRWGIEGITNLKAVPPVGALLVVGAPPIADATGMPVRAIALF